MQHVAVHIAMRTLIARRTQSRVLRPASTACPFIRSPGIITISPLGGTLRVITLFRLTLPRRLVAARLRPARFRMAGGGGGGGGRRAARPARAPVGGGSPARRPPPRRLFSPPPPPPSPRGPPPPPPPLPH